MYQKEDVTDKMGEVTVEKVIKVKGKFTTPEGRELDWHGYRVYLDTGNYKVRCKVEKVYNEVMDDLCDEE